MQRLTELAFDPGPVDGYYGSLTRQAVWAFEKLVMGVARSDATGQVTPEMWSMMQDPIQVRPRRAERSNDHVEIYLPQQVMVIFHADVPALVAHISSGQQNPDGTPYEYSEDITVDTDTEGNPLPEPVTKPSTRPETARATARLIHRADSAAATHAVPTSGSPATGAALSSAWNSHGWAQRSQYAT